MNWVRRKFDWLLKSFIIVLLKNWVLKFIKIIKECHFIKKISDIFYEIECHFLWNGVSFFVKYPVLLAWPLGNKINWKRKSLFPIRI